jgi:hypothetical protein
MNLLLENYERQSAGWPREGRHILAQFDAKSVVVYQAYRVAIGRYAVEHQRFGGEFSFNRMSWVKPNFLWMMYRNGWGTKADQEMTLAIRLKRRAFDEILAAAVHSTFNVEVYRTHEAWKAAVAQSDVRLQWDPDHGPNGAPLNRRAIQLGLHGEILRRYANEWIIEIVDVSDFVSEQRSNVGSSRLMTPAESVYPVEDRVVRERLAVETSELSNH